MQHFLNVRDLLRNLRSLILITLVEFLATQVRAGQIGKQNSNRVNINIVMFEKVHWQKTTQFKNMISVKANLDFNYICLIPLNIYSLALKAKEDHLYKVKFFILKYLPLSDSKPFFFEFSFLHTIFPHTVSYTHNLIISNQSRKQFQFFVILSENPYFDWSTGVV